MPELQIGEYPKRNIDMVVVETYLNLINRHQFTMTDEIKRLWLIRSGVLDANIVHTSTILRAMEDAQLLDTDYSAFFNLCVLTNLKAIYDDLSEKCLMRLRRADEFMVEPNKLVNTTTARRLLYWPNQSTLRDVLTSVKECILYPENAHLTNGSRLLAASVAMELDLDTLNNNSGVGYPRPECPDLIKTLVGGIHELMVICVRDNVDYRQVAYPLIRILWVITRELYGDISTEPLVPKTEALELLRTIRVSDSTLAASPCPSITALSVMASPTEPALSHLGYRYLSAIASLTARMDQY